MQIGTRVRLREAIDGAAANATGRVTWIQQSTTDPAVMLRKVRLDAVEDGAARGPQEILATVGQLEEIV